MQRTTIAVTLLPIDTYIVGDRPHELYQPEEIVKNSTSLDKFQQIKSKTIVPFVLAQFGRL